METSKEISSATSNCIDTFFDAKESLLFEDVPDNEYLLTKEFFLIDGNPETVSKNSSSISKSDYGNSDPPFVQTCDDCKKKSLPSKFQRMPNISGKRTTVQKCFNASQKETNNHLNSDADKYAKALWHAKNVQLSVRLTDIFASNALAKNGINSNGKFPNPSEIVESLVIPSKLPEKPKTSPRQNGVSKAVFQKCRSPNPACESTDSVLVSDVQLYPSFKSSIASKETLQVKPIRKKFDALNLLKKYSEKNPEAQTFPFEKVRPFVTEVVNDHGMSECYSSYASQTFLSESLLNGVKKCSLEKKVVQNGETDMADSLVQSSNLNKDFSLCKQVPHPIGNNLNHQRGSGAPDSRMDSPNVVRSETVKNQSMVSYRMQTRIQTNSLVAKNVKDLLNGKSPLWNKTEMSSPKNDKPKPSSKIVHSQAKKTVSNGYNWVKTSSPAKSSPSRQLKRTLSDDSTEHETNSLAKKSCEMNGVAPEATSCDNNLNNGVQSESDRNNPEISLPNIDFPVYKLQQPQTNLTNVFNYATKPIYINPNNAIVFGNTLMQSSTQGSQNMVPVINQLAVQQPNSFSFPLSSFNIANPYGTYPLYGQVPNVSLGPQSSIQANFLYQPCQNVDLRPEPNVQGDLNGFFSSRPLVQNVQISTGDRKNPVMQNSTCSTRTFTTTETVNTILSSEQLKAQDFSLVKKNAETARKLCIYDISDFALRFFTEEESFSKLTVKEFYMCSPVSEILQQKVSEAVTDFDDDPKIEYVFESNFEEKSLRELVKDYVTFHVEAIYKHPASKDYFVRKAFKYFPFRDCSYLCESLPKDDEYLTLKDLILYLSCSALLVIFDECKKRNIL